MDWKLAGTVLLRICCVEEDVEDEEEPEEQEE